MIDATSLFDGHGRRKYVCEAELAAFLRAAAVAPFATRTFCRLLAFTGCRISEALAVQLDTETICVVIRTLKRRKQFFRAVPIPPDLMADLLLLAEKRAPGAVLWPWCRQTAWRRV